MHAAYAFAVYAVVTGVLFRHLLPVIATHLFSDVGDPLLNVSILAWNARHVPLTDAWWNFPSFAPLAGVTAFTEHLLLFYPLTSPLIWITGSAVLAHNVAMLACFPLNGLAAWYLARALTASTAGAFVGGLAFAFAPYQSVHLSHLQTLAAFGMPLALLGLHRYFGPAATTRDLHSDVGVTATTSDERTPVASRVNRTRIRGLALFGLGWLLTALSNAYMLVFFPVLVVLWCVWRVRPRQWRQLVPVAATALLIAAALAPLLQGYYTRQRAYGFQRLYSEMQQFGADMVGLLGISHREVLWRGLLPHTYEESALFPGAAILALAVMAIVWSRRALAPGSDLTAAAGATPWARRLLWSSAVITLVVAARLWAGPFGWRLGPVALPSFAPHRLANLAVICALAGVVATRWFRAGWTRRDPVVFFVMAIVVLWLVALGPQPEWSASRIRALTYGPYYLLVDLPGFNSVRVPARAWLPATVCLSMLAAYGAAALARRRAVLVALACAIVAEGWFVDRVVAAPLPMPPGIIPENALVLDLPMDEGFWNATPQYRAVLGGYWSINGYSGYEPQHFQPLRRAIADLAIDALNPFRAFGDLHVVIRDSERPSVAEWVLDHPGSVVVYSSPDFRVVKLPPLVSPPFRPLPLALPRRGARPFALR